MYAEYSWFCSWMDTDDVEPKEGYSLTSGSVVTLSLTSPCGEGHAPL